MDETKCPICHCENIDYILNVDDWKFANYGFAKKYVYKKCTDCGCLYREETNINYDKLYDNDNYTVFAKVNSNIVPSIKDKMVKIRDSYVFMGKNKIIGGVLNCFHPSRYAYLSEYKNMLKAGASFLDVGCGRGKMVYELKEVGANVHGTEPYLDSEINYPNGLHIQKRFITDIHEKYDIVFYDNVFEHLDFPLNDLVAVKKVLNTGGICGLVFPGIGEMFEEYKENAYTIQAPQHSCLHTDKSISILAKEAGLAIKNIKRQPIEIWYTKSYLLSKGISFKDNENYDELKRKISRADFDILIDKIKKAAKKGTGDFYHVMLVKEGE